MVNAIRPPIEFRVFKGILNGPCCFKMVAVCDNCLVICNCIPNLEHDIFLEPAINGLHVLKEDLKTPLGIISTEKEIKTSK